MNRDRLGSAAICILDAMVWLESGRVAMPWSRTLVAVAARVQPKSGSYAAALGFLKRKGLISYPDPGALALEHAGRQLAMKSTRKLTLLALHGDMLVNSRWAERGIMKRCLKAFPEELDRAAMQRSMHVKTAEFRNAVARLRAKGLVVLPSPGLIRAHSDLFPEIEA